jgi:hypothetical protein
VICDVGAVFARAEANMEHRGADMPLVCLLATLIGVDFEHCGAEIPYVRPLALPLSSAIWPR